MFVYAEIAMCRHFGVHCLVERKRQLLQETALLSELRIPSVCKILDAPVIYEIT